MVQSTDSPCFELLSWTDLLDKAGNDLIDLHLLVNSYSLFNCLCTLNHIPDWISADPKCANIAVFVEEIRKDRNVDTVRQLCNRAKHFSRKPVSPLTEVHDGYGSGRYGVGAYQDGEPSYFVEVEGAMENVIVVLSAARAKWESIRHVGEWPHKSTA
jgi:hypothetical protein